MKTIDVFRLAFGNLKANKARTTFTILGVSIGYAAVLFLVSLGYGLERLTTSKLLTLSELSTVTVTPGKSEILKLNDGVVERIAKIENVEKTAPVISLPAQITLNKTTTDSVIYGVQIGDIKVSGVRDIDFGTVFAAESTDEAIISESVLKLFDIENPKDVLGSQVTVNVFLSASGEPAVAGETLEQRSLTYKIIGVSGDANIKGLYVPQNTLKELGVSTYSFLKVKAVSQEHVKSVKKSIEEMGFTVSAVRETLDQMTRFFNILKGVLGGFGMIALFVAAIGMLNTLTVSLLERIHDIGIMKAVGATNWDIRRLMFAEALIISFLGGVFGVAGGLGFGFLVNTGVNLLARAAGGEPVALFFTPVTFVVIVVSSSVIIGFLTGFYPAKRAVRLNPLDALRYE